MFFTENGYDECTDYHKQQCDNPLLEPIYIGYCGLGLFDLICTAKDNPDRYFIFPVGGSTPMDRDYFRSQMMKLTLDHSMTYDQVCDSIRNYKNDNYKSSLTILREAERLLAIEKSMVEESATETLMSPELVVAESTETLMNPELVTEESK